ncbi:MAG: copper resistance protein B [Pseudomonadota bacterium]
MKRLLQVLGLLLPVTALAAEHDHSAAPPNAPATAHDHAAMTTAPTTPAMAAAVHTNMLEHGGMLNSLLLIDRIEQQQRDGDDAWTWDAQAWYGGDYNKLWLKTEGAWNQQQHATEDSDVQLLFGRSVAPYWDLQAGLRHSEGSGASRSHLVLGLQGLAPYWFEVDAAAFISEQGDVQLRFEVEYDLRLTQRLLLQPRLELNHAFADDRSAGIEQGLMDSSAGLRLRYELIREFAPYIGVERDLGDHRQPDATRVVAGFRIWY